MLEAIDAFLHLLRNAPADVQERECALAAALDRLACALHDLPAGEVADDWESQPAPPGWPYSERSELASKAFPELGLYPWSDPLGKVDDDPMMCDAIDDLADIAGDLAAAAWIWRNVGAKSAQWQLHFDHDAHWGAHLYSLRAYLHAVIGG